MEKFKNIFIPLIIISIAIVWVGKISNAKSYFPKIIWAAVDLHWDTIVKLEKEINTTVFVETVFYRNEQIKSYTRNLYKPYNTNIISIKKLLPHFKQHFRKSNDDYYIKFNIWYWCNEYNHTKASGLTSMGCKQINSFDTLMLFSDVNEPYPWDWTIKECSKVKSLWQEGNWTERFGSIKAVEECKKKYYFDDNSALNYKINLHPGKDRCKIIRKWFLWWDWTWKFWNIVEVKACKDKYYDLNWEEIIQTTLHLTTNKWNNNFTELIQWKDVILTASKNSSWSWNPVLQGVKPRQLNCPFIGFQNNWSAQWKCTWIKANNVSNNEIYFYDKNDLKNRSNNIIIKVVKDTTIKNDPPKKSTNEKILYHFTINWVNECIQWVWIECMKPASISYDDNFYLTVLVRNNWPWNFYDKLYASIKNWTKKEIYYLWKKNLLEWDEKKIKFNIRKSLELWENKLKIWFENINWQMLWMSYQFYTVFTKKENWNSANESKSTQICTNPPLNSVPGTCFDKITNENIIERYNFICFNWYIKRDKKCIINNTPPSWYEGEIISNNPSQSNFKDESPYTIEWKAANSLYVRWIIWWYPDGTFKWDNLVNRAEAAKFLILARFWNNFGSSYYTWELNYISNLRDLKQNEWYASFVNAADFNGIINWYDDWTFRPSTWVRRGEFLKMLTKTFNLYENLDHGFYDVKWTWVDAYAWIVNRYDLFPNIWFELKYWDFMTRNEVTIAIYNYFQNKK